MQIGNIVITSKDEVSRQGEEITKLQKYIAENIEKIHKEEGPDLPQIHMINKNLSSFGVPYNEWVTSRKKNVYQQADLDILKFWSDELPQAPQAIEYVVSMVFSRGYSFVLNEDKQTNEELLNKIKNTFTSANPNETPLVELLKTAIRYAHQVGNGYIEKVKSKKGDSYVAFYNVKPWNMVVVTDKVSEGQGILKIKGYLKVDKATKDKYYEDLTADEKRAMLSNEDVIHIKYIDEGDKYGHSAFEKNQEFTKFVINVMNRNQKKFTNDLRHSLLVRLGRKASQIDADIFISQYRANYLGKNNYGKPLVVFGDIEVERWDLEDKDFDYENFMQKLGINHAPSLLKVAPSELLNNDAKYSNSNQGHVTTVLNTIYDWQERIETIVNEDILKGIEGLIGDRRSEVPTYKFKLTRENLFTMYEFLPAITGSVMAGIMTPNEARKIVDPTNLPQIDDEWANQHYVLVGQSLSVINQEYFGGDDEAELSYDDKGKLINLNGFFKTEKSKK